MAEERRQVRNDSDRLLTELEELKRLESQKRGEDFSSPPFHALADRVEDQARSVFELAVQEELDGNRTETADISIDEVGDGRSPSANQPHPGALS